MKLLITNNNKDIAIVKDFSDLDKDHTGLMGQLVMELENLKQEIILIYTSGGIENIDEEDV